MSDFAEPLPRDPKSIDVWPTFLAGCRAWARLLVPLSLLFVLSYVPVALLSHWVMPTFSALMFSPGMETPEIPTREWFGLAGIMVLMILGGGLATMAAVIASDHILAGEPVPGPGPTTDRVLERVLPVLGTWILLLVVMFIPPLLLTALLVATAAGLGAVSGGVASASEEPSAAFVFGMLVGMVVVMVPMIAVAIYGRFGPLRATVRARGPVGSLRDSVALVRGRFWRTFGYLMLVNVVLQAVFTGALMFAYLAFTLHPALAILIYATAIAVVMPFQIVQEVALMRRLEPLAGLVPDTAPPAATDALAAEPL